MTFVNDTARLVPMEDAMTLTRYERGDAQRLGDQLMRGPAGISFATWAKAGTCTGKCWTAAWIDTGSAIYIGFFNLTTGTVGVGTLGACTPRIRDMHNGWYHCEISCAEQSYETAWFQGVEADGALNWGDHFGVSERVRQHLQRLLETRGVK